jgi:hypothetical protein
VINLTKRLPGIMGIIYEHIFQSFKGTKLEKQKTEFEAMYILSALKLKKDGKTWWVTLEPTFSVTSQYNHFLRFSLCEDRLVWASIANGDLKSN